MSTTAKQRLQIKYRMNNTRYTKIEGEFKKKRQSKMRAVTTARFRHRPGHNDQNIASIRA